MRSIVNLLVLVLWSPWQAPAVGANSMYSGLVFGGILIGLPVHKKIT